ncbi:MAG: PAS domain S-box protein [Gammaproteobacteria bacterium]
MSNNDNTVDSLAIANGELRRASERSKFDELLRSRTGIILVLVLPLILVFAITFGGYLYFNYQSIRASLGDRQFDRLSQAAQLIREEFTAIHYDIITLLLDPALFDNEPGNASTAGDSLLLELVGSSQRYEYIALLDPLGNELVRANRQNSGATLVSSGNLGTHADALYFSQAMDQQAQQVFGTSVQLMDTASDDPLENALIFFTIPQKNTDNNVTSVLLLAHRAGPLFGNIARMASNSPSNIWLVNSDGQILASRINNTPFRFIADIPERLSLAAQQPDIWSALQEGVERSTTIPGGLLSRANVCGQTNCLSASGQLVTSISQDNAQLDGWNLVALLPQAAMSPLRLLSAQNNRWLTLTMLLLLAGIVASACAWFLGSTLATLRRQEDNLKRVNLVQDAFFEKNPEIMFVKNLDGTYFLANEKCRELAGMPEADFSGQDRNEFFPANASSTMAEQDKQVISRRQAMEFHTKWKRDGVMQHFKTLRFPIYGGRREIVAVGGIANDVTEQVQSRQALMENENLLRTFIESAPEAVLICDGSAKITLVNKKAELVFGFAREEILEHSLLTLLPSLDMKFYEDAIRDSNSPTEPVVYELLEGHGQGSNLRKFPVDYSLAPIITEDGALMICLLRDVSDRALMETQLRQSQKMDAIGKLTGGMAHDFNNLLGIIIGNVALAMRQVKGEGRLEKRLETVMMAANRGAELTKRMLAVARRQPLQPKPLDINSVIEELTKMLPQTMGSHIKMELDLQQELPPVLLDESGFEALLLNLSINSRDAMPNGGSFTVSTSVKARKDVELVLPQTKIQDCDYIQITVRDTGTGMTQEALSRAFEPFFTTKDKGKGTGLGLAMIYGFVKQSSGYIVLNSEPGAGTTAYIFFPTTKETAIDTVKENEAQHCKLVQSGSHTVLIVDDETELLSIAEAYLEEHGFKVLTAENGKAALEVVKQHPEIALIVTDIVMPGGMNGPALAAEIEKDHQHIRFLYASGFPSGAVAESAGELLDAPLIHKPYTREVLISQVVGILSQAT